jgi:two-component system sensor kinase FixL
VNTRLLDTMGTATAPHSVPVAVFDRRLLVAALLTGAGYYLGVKVGFALTFDPHPIAVLWPPNAILLAALLVAPARWWGWLIGAAFAAHLVAQLEASVPAAMVLCWFLTNAAEALIGAVCVRRYTRQGPLLFSLGSVTVFIAFAVVLAPFLTSFLDAGFVTLIGWGTAGYWELWSARFFSNVLTTLTIVPPIVAFAAERGSPLRWGDPSKIAEAALLLTSAIAVCIAVFFLGPAESGATVALVYLPLPFLLWAALRFGPAGASTLFVIVAFAAVWSASHGHGPFSTNSPHENAFAVQVFLMFVAVTLLCLTAAVQERRDAEGRLRDSEERFATAFRSSPDAMSIQRKSDGRIIEINDRWKDIIGFRRAEAVGRTGWDLGLYGDEAEYTRFLALIGEHGGAREAELALRSREGREILGLIAAESVEMGGESCIIVTMRDMTAQRSAELEAREQRQQLTHLTRVATVGELSGALAHELNQPLTAILSNAQAAQRFLARDPVDLTEIREILGDIVEADKRAGLVIRRLRTMLKKGEVQFAPLDLNEVLADVLDLAHGDLVTRNVTVATRFNLGAPLVSGDRVELQQLFLNLVSNACEAMGGLDLVRRELVISTSYEWDGTVQAAVTDRGRGIPPERMGRLFEPFYTTKEQGLGLGLAICRTIATAHGGRIWGENSAEGGATFTVSLPTQQARA